MFIALMKLIIMINNYTEFDRDNVTLMIFLLMCMRGMEVGVSVCDDLWLVWVGGGCVWVVVCVCVCVKMKMNC